MDAKRFDQLAKTFATAISPLGSRSNRRTALRVGTGVLVGVTTSSFVRGQVRAAESSPGLPPESRDPWPACSDTESYDSYCIAEFSVDGVDQLATNPPRYEAIVHGSTSRPNDISPDRLEWRVHRRNLEDWDGSLTQAELSKEVHLRFRSGQLNPVVAFSRGVGVEMRVTGSDAEGWEAEFRGHPGISPTSQPSDPEQATFISLVYLAGMALIPSSPFIGDWEGYEGYMASTAKTFGTPQWVGDGWQVYLESPHFMPDGSVTHGSYNAWMTAGTLQRLGLTVDQAVNGGLTVTQTEDGVTSPAQAEIFELDGGVYFRIPDITFSQQIISIRGRGRGKCARKCRKGRVCRKGRCVKKKG